MIGLHDAIKDACITVIQGLGLKSWTGDPLPNTSILREMLIDVPQVDLPCIVVSTDGLRESLLPGDTISKEIEYPVNVLFMNRLSPRSIEMEASIEAWRETIFDAFQQKNPLRIPVPVVFQSMVEPSFVFEDKSPQYQLMTSGMTIKFSAWIPRS